MLPPPFLSSPRRSRRTASARSASVSGSLSSMATASANGTPTGPASGASCLGLPISSDVVSGGESARFAALFAAPWLETCRFCWGFTWVFESGRAHHRFHTHQAGKPLVCRGFQQVYHLVVHSNASRCKSLLQRFRAQMQRILQRILQRAAGRCLRKARQPDRRSARESEGSTSPRPSFCASSRQTRRAGEGSQSAGSTTWTKRLEGGRGRKLNWLSLSWLSGCFRRGHPSTQERKDGDPTPLFSRLGYTMEPCQAWLGMKMFPALRGEQDGVPTQKSNPIRSRRETSRHMVREMRFRTSHQGFGRMTLPFSLTEPGDAIIKRQSQIVPFGRHFAAGQSQE